MVNLEQSGEPTEAAFNAGNAAVPPSGVAVTTIQEINNLVDVGSIPPTSATLNFFGTAVVGQIFGRHTARQDQITDIIDLTAQVVPEGSALVVEILRSGVPTGSTITLGDGQSHSSFESPLSLSAGEYLELKINQVGATSPGGYLSVNIQLNPV